MSAAPSWPDTVDEILGGDQAVMLGYPTSAAGVVLTPVTNFAVRDPDTGTVTVNTSIGAWRKLDRIRHDPHVALAFHTREHAAHRRPEYVLVQGTASLSEPIANYPATVPDWERFDGPRGTGPVWERWLRVYYTRVSIEITVHRVIVWPDLRCHGEPAVHGAALPTAPAAAQHPPARGTGPRLDHARATARLSRLPNLLLGWLGADRLPVMLPTTITGTTDCGILLDMPNPWPPPGGRRAGLTAHSFTRHVIGQHQRVHTGWLQTEPGAGWVCYAPHTQRGHRMPPSLLLYRLAVGAFTRAGLRGAHRARLLADEPA